MFNMVGFGAFIARALFSNHALDWRHIHFKPVLQCIGSGKCSESCICLTAVYAVLFRRVCLCEWKGLRLSHCHCNSITSRLSWFVCMSWHTVSHVMHDSTNGFSFFFFTIDAHLSNGESSLEQEWCRQARKSSKVSPHRRLESHGMVDVYMLRRS